MPSVIGVMLRTTSRYDTKSLLVGFCLYANINLPSFKAMWMMLQLDKPEDFVVCTGEQYSVRQFVERAFEHIGEKIRYACFLR